ncbi:YfzA family protein [Sporosarcina sp. ACRSL]|uniref:YfzA family protein n=1 Tax=Sporosarcina sp. ACRSL TaxID=2918215 RepID=UPI001EF5980C|nr:YfzA family protein [Sporosarcina sp. ACRSL]MCG7345999.1 YfzA family protein [Sporosarcina sp. ACRSL]
MYRELKQEDNRSNARRNIFRGWPIHLLLFVAFQIMFILFDGSSIWRIFNPNNLGMKLIDSLHPFFERFQPYTSEQLNYVTAVWGFVVVGHGIAWFVERSRGKQQ